MLAFFVGIYEFQLADVIKSCIFLLICNDVNIIILGICHQRGGCGGRHHGFHDFHVYLCRRELILHGFGFIHMNLECGCGIFQSVLDIDYTGCGLHDVDNLSGIITDLIQVTAFDHDGETVSEKLCHIRRGGLHLNRTLDILGLFLNLILDVFHLALIVFIKQKIVACAVSASHAEEAERILAAHHNADGLDTVNRHDRFGNFIAELHHLLFGIFFLLGSGNRHGNLVHFNIHIEEGEASRKSGENTGSE